MNTDHRTLTSRVYSLDALHSLKEASLSESLYELAKTLSSVDTAEQRLQQARDRIALIEQAMIAATQAGATLSPTSMALLSRQHEAASMWAAQCRRQLAELRQEQERLQTETAMQRSTLDALERLRQRGRRVLAQHRDHKTAVSLDELWMGRTHHAGERP